VLFQVGPIGLHWHRPLENASVARARVERKLDESLAGIGSSQSIEIVFDEQLDGRLGEWLQLVAPLTQ
jgi:hypothetical protein